MTLISPGAVAAMVGGIGVAWIPAGPLPGSGWVLPDPLLSCVSACVSFSISSCVLLRFWLLRISIAYFSIGRLVDWSIVVIDCVFSKSIAMLLSAISLFNFCYWYLYAKSIHFRGPWATGLKDLKHKTLC
jgi:hypothetical protein